MSKIHSLGVQFTNSTVRMYLNDPQIQLEIGHGRDTSPLRLKINGDTIGCETIAKLIIDGKIHTFLDPYIIPVYKDKGWVEEEIAWKGKLGQDCFNAIQDALGGDGMISQFLDTPFPKDEDVQKRKRLMEMQISKELYEKRKEKEERERKEKEEQEKLKANQQSYTVNPSDYSISEVGSIAINDVITGSSEIGIGLAGVSFTREEIAALKKAAKEAMNDEVGW